MILERLPELKTWSDYDKWQLVEELEAELTGQQDVTELPEVKEKIAAWCEKQLEKYHADSSTATSWKELRARLLNNAMQSCTK